MYISFNKYNMDRILPIVIIAIGILLRVKIFLLNCSFNIDEASIGVDLYARNFLQIAFNQLHYGDLPNRPVGLLLLQKLSLTIFGYHDWAIRLVPFISSIVAIFLFARVTKSHLSQNIWMIALALFAFNEHLIFFSASAKQYSTDVLVTILLMMLFHKVYFETLTRKDIHWVGIYGVMAMYFSFTSVFVLPAILIGHYIINHYDLKVQKANLIVGLYWLIGFTVFYFIYFEPMNNNPDIMYSAKNWFMPQSLDAIQWTGDSLYSVFKDPGGVYPNWLGAVLLLVGIYALFIEKKGKVIILTFPLLFVFLAAICQKYPFHSRYLMFLVPMLLILISGGAGYFLDYRFMKYARLPMVIVIVLFAFPLKSAAYYLSMYQCKNEYKELTLYFKEQVRPDDLILINTKSQFPYWYYGRQLNVNYNLTDKELGEWNRQQIFGQQVGRLYDQIITKEDGRKFAELRYEEFAYDKMGTFKTKITKDVLSKKIYLIHEDAPAPITRNNRIWLLFYFASDELKEYVIYYLSQHGIIQDRYRNGKSELYLFVLE